MPRRIATVALQCLRTQSAPQAQSASRVFSTTPSTCASTVTQKRKHRDPYAIAQAKARKAANLSRQEVLKKERAAVLGDPVRGETTPFVRSFDTALPPEPSPPSASTHTRIDQSPSRDAPGPQIKNDDHFNFFLSKNELESSLERSRWLTHPLPEDVEEKDQERSETVDRSTQSSSDGKQITEQQRRIAELLDGAQQAREASGDSRYHSLMGVNNLLDSSTPQQKTPEEQHKTAEEALKRIASLSLGSSKDRMRVNTQRCIETFGRHNTDRTLPTRPQSADDQCGPIKFPRVGQDTGSSEVQIAILTAKIRTLANNLESRGRPDKVNKRNLRLLVHRRAKLLNYLRRKERGGPRWQHLVETLGLTEGTYRGEISL